MSVKVKRCDTRKSTLFPVNIYGTCNWIPGAPSKTRRVKQFCWLLEKQPTFYTKSMKLKARLNSKTLLALQLTKIRANCTRSDFARKPPAIFITRMEPRVKGQSAFWLRLNNLPKACLPTQDVWPFGACGWVSANYENRRNELQNNYQCRWFLKWHRQWARRHQKQRCFRTSYFLLLRLKNRRRNT